MHTIISVDRNGHEVVQNIPHSCKWQLQRERERETRLRVRVRVGTDHCLFVGQNLGDQTGQSHALLKPDVTTGQPGTDRQTHIIHIIISDVTPNDRRQWLC